MKLKIIKVFFGLTEDNMINLIGPCIICKRMNRKTKKCSITDELIPREHTYDYECEETDDEYYCCIDFKMRLQGRKKLI